MTDPVHRDPFSGVLITPNPLNLSDEQKDNIRLIIEKSSSDSRFALKAYLAIMKTLIGGDVTPVIISIDPTEGHSGDAVVAIAVHGTDFEAGSRVLQAGVVISTSFVDDKEVRATVNLSGAAPGVMAISVRNSSGITSNVVNLDVLDPLTLLEQDGIIGSLSPDREDRNKDGELNRDLDRLVDVDVDVDVDIERARMDELDRLSREREERDGRMEKEQPDVDPPRQVSDVPATGDYDAMLAKIAEFNRESEPVSTNEGINPPYEPVSTDPIPSPVTPQQEDNPFTPQDDTRVQPNTTAPVDDAPLNRYDADQSGGGPMGG